MEEHKPPAGKTTHEPARKAKTGPSPKTGAPAKGIRGLKKRKLYAVTRVGGLVEVRASRYETRLTFIRRVLGSDSAVADALGVDRAQVTRWQGTAEPSRENAERLTGLDAAIELLSDYLEPEAIADWLTGFNAHLGGRRPVDVLRAGRIADVIGAIEAFKAGAFA